MLTEQQVQAKVADIIEKAFKKEKGSITSATRFEEDLAADSLEVVELVMSLEEEFKAEISDEDADGTAPPVYDETYAALMREIK